MKKWMNYMVIMGLTAGTASAAWWPFGGNEKEETAPAVPAMEPMKEHQRPQLTPEQMEKMKARKLQMKQREPSENRPQGNSEQMQKMKDRRDELMKLGEAARNATDPVQKEALVGQLRVKLTEVADNMQAEGQSRMAQAEKEIAKLKERQVEAEKNKEARVEQQIQRILSGEPMRDPAGKRPEGAPGKEGKKRPKAPGAE